MAAESSLPWFLVTWQTWGKNVLIRELSTDALRKHCIINVSDTHSGGCWHLSFIGNILTPIGAFFLQTDEHTSKNKNNNNERNQEILVKILDSRAAEMAQWFRTMTALPEEWGSSPSNHMAAHNHLLLHRQGIWHFLLANMGNSYLWYIDKIQAKHPYTL